MHNVHSPFHGRNIRQGDEDDAESESESESEESPSIQEPQSSAGTAADHSHREGYTKGSLQNE